ncbi:ABC transporter substrate-binding protein [Lachnospiraceae bacterium ZAX-1]
MKKRTKILTCLLMCAVMVLGGCNGAGAEVGGDGNKADTSKTDNSSEETAELILVMPGNDAAPASLHKIEEGINAITKEKMNATVKIQIIPWGSYDEQVNLMLSGSEPMDMMITMKNPSGYYQRGQILSMEDLIDQYAPEAKEVLGDDLEACRLGGEIYGLYPFHDIAQTAGLCARTDILEEIGADPEKIKTWDDVTNLLQSVKDAYPEMNILTPGTLKRGIVENLVISRFDILTPGIGTAYDSDGKVVNIYGTDKYKEIVEMAYDWYNKGYILSDANTNTETRESHIKAGDTFGYIVSTKPGMDTQETLATGMDMTAITIDEPTINTGSIAGFQWVLPRTSSNPEKAMEFYNLMFTDADIQNYFIYGIEDTDYVKISDNVIGYPEGVDGSNAGWVGNSWFAGNCYISYIWDGNSEDSWKQLEEFNEGAKRSPLFGYLFDTEVNKNEIAAIANAESKYKTLLESGMADPEKTITEFIKAMDDAGANKVIEEAEGQIEVWKAK